VWIASLMVQYRDFRFIVPFVIQFGLYISPVGFMSSVVPAEYKTLYALNPMVGVIDGFRWCVLGQSHHLDGMAVIVSIVITTIVLVTGIYRFRKTELTFADII
jgi:lipopolysaccharide transport system permease protein